MIIEVTKIVIGYLAFIIAVAGGITLAGALLVMMFGGE